MSQTELPYDQYGGTGWALFDWVHSSDRPQLTFVAGNMHSLRLQFDAYRRVLQMPYAFAQIQLWVWSQNDFRLTVYKPGPNTTETLYPTAYPDTETTVSAVTLREYRIPTGGAWGGGTYQNNRTTTSNQMTIVNRFFGIHEIATPANFVNEVVRITISQPGTKSKVRLLAIGHHNNNFENGT